MTGSPVIFRPIADGRELVLLGMIPVGEIAPGHVERFFWRLRLPLCPEMGRAQSLEHVHQLVRDKVEQWLEAAHLVPIAQEQIRTFRPDDCGKIKQAVRP